MLSRLHLASAAAFALLSTAAHADTPETVVVTGQRTADDGTKLDVPLVEVPQAVTVITRDDMDRRGVDTVGEAVRYSPGVSADYYGPDGRGFEWIQLRGFGTFDSTYRDGMRVFNYGFNEAYGLESVDIVRGPSSVLYGQAPPGGVVNSVSKLPPLKSQGEIELDVGNRSLYQGSFDVGGPVFDDGTVSARLVGLYRDDDLQFRYTDGPSIVNDRRYIAPSATWHIDDATTLTVLGDYLKQEGGFGWYAPMPDGTPTRVLMTDRGWDRDWIYNYDAGYIFEHDFSANLKLKSRLRYTFLDDDGRYLSDLGFNTPDQPTLLDRYAQRWYTRSHAWTTDTMLEGKFETFGAAHLAIAGVDYAGGYIFNQEQVGDAPPLDVADPVYGQHIAFPTDVDWHERIDFNQLGFYAQDQVKWERWILTAGIRHDHAQSRDLETVSGTDIAQDDSALTGRVGLGYAFAGGITPYVSWSRSFLPNLGSDVNNVAFKPSEAEQLEAGVKYQATDGLFLTATVFSLEQTNVLTDDTANPGFQVARGAVRSQGVELEARGRITPELDIDASYTYNPVKIVKSNAGDQGNYLPLLPLNAASVYLDYSVPDGMLKGLELGGGVRYVGDTWTDTFNTRKNADQALLDLRASYGFGRWQVSLDAENVLDDTLMLNDGFSYYYETERRTVTLGLRYKW